MDVVPVPYDYGIPPRNYQRVNTEIPLSEEDGELSDEEETAEDNT
jgi:hypothetical protein